MKIIGYNNRQAAAKTGCDELIFNRRFTKCNEVPVMAQVRDIFPVFAGISGSTRTI